MSNGIFGQHAFGMPMFSAPSIPMIEAGRLGPHFDQRPTPPAFPGASAVQGCSGCGGGVDDWQDYLPDVVKDALVKAGQPAITALEPKVRAEAAKAAEKAVTPLVQKAIFVSAAAGVLSLIALWAAFRR